MAPRIRRGNEQAASPDVADVTPGAAPTPPIMHGDDTMSPVDLPGSTTIGGRPLLWTTTTIYLAALFLAVTNASAIHGWAVELTPSGWSAHVVTMTEGWEGATDRLGLGTARETMHGWWKQAQAARFGGERAG